MFALTTIFAGKFELLFTNQNRNNRQMIINFTELKVVHRSWYKTKHFNWEANLKSSCQSLGIISTIIFYCFILRPLTCQYLMQLTAEFVDKICISFWKSDPLQLVELAVVGCDCPSPLCTVCQDKVLNVIFTSIWGQPSLNISVLAGVECRNAFNIYIVQLTSSDLLLVSDKLFCN